MLTGSNNHALIRKGINPELIFFYQRWQEILDSRTLDMYQYNILNSYVALLEFADVITKTLSGIITSRQNIDDTRAETLEIIKHDDILINYNKPLYVTLLRIASSKVENDDGVLKRILHKLMTPIRLLENHYLNYILQEIEADITTQNNAQMEKHMTYLVSQCIHNGWSARGLLNLSQCFIGKMSIHEKWQFFANNFDLQCKNLFEIYYSINIETRQGITVTDVREIILSLDMIIKKGTEIIEAHGNTVLSSKIEASKYYIVVSLEATDIFSATLSAINSLNKKLSVATFYNTINPWIANSPQIIAWNANQNIVESLKITDVFKTYDYVDSNNKVFEDTKNILSSPEKIHIMNRLHAAFSYTNLSRSDRVRIIGVNSK